MTRIAILAALLAYLGPAAVRSDPVWTADMPRISPDPVNDAVMEHGLTCVGTPSLDDAFMRQADVDGDGTNDAILNYGALRCDGVSRHCGSAGCRQDIWLSLPDGDWRLVLRDRVHELHVPMPGVVVTWVDSGSCGMARACFRAYDAWGGTLRLLEPGAEVGPAP